MIELNQEQWRAIAQQESATLIDPDSKTAYVVVRKEEYDKLRALGESEADAALILRVAWMRRMGLDEEEIAEAVRDDPPVSIQQEMKQLRALDNLDKITPPVDVLRKHAIKY